MKLTGPQTFALCWGVLALVIGFTFARFPKLMAAQYEQQLRSAPLIRKREITSAQRERIVIFYRIGGVFFMALGVAVALSAALGAIR
jgi:hypothetical protein